MLLSSIEKASLYQCLTWKISAIGGGENGQSSRRGNTLGIFVWKCLLIRTSSEHASANHLTRTSRVQKRLQYQVKCLQETIINVMVQLLLEEAIPGSICGRGVYSLIERDKWKIEWLLLTIILFIAQNNSKGLFVLPGILFLETVFCFINTYVVWSAVFSCSE